MPAEAWVALGIGVTGIAGSILWAVFYLSARFAAAVTKFELIGVGHATEIARINIAMEKIEVTVQTIAVDRERAAALERRVATVERWYDELRRGVGRIETA